MTETYRLFRPARQETSVIFASPHSGRDYSAAFVARSVLDLRTLRSSEDAFVDDLFAPAVAHGAPLLAARTPRAFVDFNRAPDELDPALIDGIARAPHNPRVSSGLGVIPRVVSGARAIYSGKLTLAEAEARISGHWHPYHEALRALVDQTHAAFGEAILIDCHSMPHEALEGQLRPGQIRPDVVLGDRFGAAASGRIVERIEAAFTAAGLRVARNAPFAGAFVAQSYGRPSGGRHVVQIEIDRSLYLDEAQIAPHAGFGRFSQRIEGVIAEIAAIGRPAGAALAAE